MTKFHKYEAAQKFRSNPLLINYTLKMKISINCRKKKTTQIEQRTSETKFATAAVTRIRIFKENPASPMMSLNSLLHNQQEL